MTLLEKFSKSGETNINILKKVSTFQFFGHDNVCHDVLLENEVLADNRISFVEISTHFFSQE